VRVLILRKEGYRGISSRMRDVRVFGNDPNGSMDRPQRGTPSSSVYARCSDRRLGVDWGKFGRAFVNRSTVGTSLTCRVLVLWMWGAIRLQNLGVRVRNDMSKSRRRGAALDRSRLNAVRPSRGIDINVQFSGAEMIDSRQYRYT